MIVNYFNHLLIYLIISLEIVELYIVFPLKSTNTLFLSKIKNEKLTINNKEIIHEIFSKWINITLYIDLLVGDPYQKATTFLSTEEVGFTYYEEFSLKELKELNINDYHEYFKNNSQSITRSNELNYNFSFWEYLSFEEPLYIHKFDENQIFSYKSFKDKKLVKTKNIHFLYAIRHSSKIPEIMSDTNFENKHQEAKKDLRKLNYTSFSYFCFGLQMGGKRNFYSVKSVIEEFSSKHEVSGQDWSIYFPKEITDNNNYVGFLFLGSTPHQYLSNIFKENELLYVESESFDWTWRACLSFYKVYIKKEDKILNIKNYEMKAKLDFNFDIIKGTFSAKNLIDQHFFSSLISLGKCFESKIQGSYLSSYTFYYCDKNKIAKNDIENFPTIYFHHIEFSNVFELTYKDLFETFNDVILFKIVFDTKNEWTFGKLFLKKYMFSYNDGSKKIYFYNNNYLINPNDEKIKENILKSIYFEIGIIIILVFIFGILGFLIGKYIFKKYKKDANELENIYNKTFISLKENEIIEMKMY